MKRKVTPSFCQLTGLWVNAVMLRRGGSVGSLHIRGGISEVRPVAVWMIFHREAHLFRGL